MQPTVASARLQGASLSCGEPCVCMRSVALRHSVAIVAGALCSLCKPCLLDAYCPYLLSNFTHMPEDMLTSMDGHTATLRQAHAAFVEFSNLQDMSVQD